MLTVDRVIIFEQTGRCFRTSYMVAIEVHWQKHYNFFKNPFNFIFVIEIGHNTPQFVGYYDLFESANRLKLGRLTINISRKM